MRIGVIADTHGHYDERIDLVFAGVDLIIHAGDIGAAKPAIIDRLELLAPVSVVTGNVDWNTPLDIYPLTAKLVLDGVHIFVQHIGGKPAAWSKQLPDPLPAVAICGHSHQALIQQYWGVLFINPGSAGKPRFGSLPTVALLEIEAGQPHATIVALRDVAPAEN